MLLLSGCVYGRPVAMWHAHAAAGDLSADCLHAPTASPQVALVLQMPAPSLGAELSSPWTAELLEPFSQPAYRPPACQPDLLSLLSQPQ